jgi:hypothetical protein
LDRVPQRSTGRGIPGVRRSFPGTAIVRGIQVPMIHLPAGNPLSTIKAVPKSGHLSREKCAQTVR